MRINCFVPALRHSAAAGVIALFCSYPVTVAASPESKALTDKGMAEFQAQRYRRAIEFFNSAVRADSKDRQPVFMQAASLNRLGSHREAYLLFSGLEGAGAKHAEMDFEMGWSLMGMKRAQACVDRLERFEKSQPGRGQTSEFLGRCYLMLGLAGQAAAKFQEAVAREPRLKPGVDLAMVAVEKIRARPDALAERQKAAAQADTPTGRALREIVGVPPQRATGDKPESDKPFRAGFSLSAGYNDNVIGLGNTIPLPTDITRKSANFLRANAGATYTRKLDEKTVGTLGYALVADRYQGLSVSNLDDHFAYGDLLHRYNERTGLSLRVSDEYTTLGGSRFRNQMTVRPAVAYRFTEASATEFALSYARASYYMATPLVFNRDGTTSTWSATHFFRVPDTPWSGAVAASYQINRAEGNDFTFDGYGVSGSLRWDFTPKIAGVISAGFTRYDYGNVNSLSAGFARDDEQTQISAQLVGPITENLRWFVQAQRLRNASNIAFYDFTQKVISVGIGASF